MEELDDHGILEVRRCEPLPEALLRLQTSLHRAVNSSVNAAYFDDRSRNDVVRESQLGAVHSPLQVWCGSNVRQRNGRKALVPLSQMKSIFPLLPVADEIARTVRDHDVVLLIAPTGVGKSLLAPYIAEQLLKAENRRGTSFYRKSLMVVPSAEHCGSTVRSIDLVYRHSGLIVDGYLNQHEKVNRGSDSTERDESAEFVCTTYDSALRVLPDASLNLLILDEVHETNCNVQVTLAMAMKMLTGEPFVQQPRQRTTRTPRKLNRLILMTATLDAEERRRYKRYLLSFGVSCACLDYTTKVSASTVVTMSCYTSEQMPDRFEITPLSEAITCESRAGRRQSRDELERRAEPEAKQFTRRLRDALEMAMRSCVEDLEARIRRSRGSAPVHMKSIIVILPGLEQVDDLYGGVFAMPYFRFEIDGVWHTGFHAIRLTSLVKDDYRITQECAFLGGWQPYGGHQGRIVFTTNLVASGLTVPHAAFVIDSGMQKVPSAYRMAGLRSLETTWIDGLMITQRAGRTGRTLSGEYFLPLSAAKVQQMQQTKKQQHLLHRHFEERHYLLTAYYSLDLLHPPPESLIKELLQGMEIRGLISVDDVISRDVLLMLHYFPFLPTEMARIVIQGVRLGIAAHVIYWVAETCARIKFVHTPSKHRRDHGGPAEKRRTLDIFARAMDLMSIFEDPRDFPSPYRGAGDSVALADLLVSYHLVVAPGPNTETTLAKTAANVDWTNFWGGAWSRERDRGVRRNSRDEIIREQKLYDLNILFVREEGRNAVHRLVVQIRSVLRSLGLLHIEGKKGSITIFDPAFNRHIKSHKNYCLNDDGRAIFGALLAMNSSRLGCWENTAQPASYYISDEEAPESGEQPVEFVFPESTYCQAECDWAEGPVYGRFSEAFKTRHHYRAHVDPITPKRIAYFFNINGTSTFREESNEAKLEMDLTAAPSSNGMSGVQIQMPLKAAEHIDTMRYVLSRTARLLSVTRNSTVVKSMEQLLVQLWRWTYEPPKGYEPRENGDEEEDVNTGRFAQQGTDPDEVSYRDDWTSGDSAERSTSEESQVDTGRFAEQGTDPDEVSYRDDCDSAERSTSEESRVDTGRFAQQGSDSDEVSYRNGRLTDERSEGARSRMSPAEGSDSSEEWTTARESLSRDSDRSGLRGIWPEEEDDWVASRSGGTERDDADESRRRDEMHPMYGRDTWDSDSW